MHEYVKCEHVNMSTREIENYERSRRRSKIKTRVVYRMKTFTAEKLLQRSMLKCLNKRWYEQRILRRMETGKKPAQDFLCCFCCDNMAHQTHDVLTPTL